MPAGRCWRCRKLSSACVSFKVLRGWEKGRATAPPAAPSRCLKAPHARAPCPGLVRRLTRQLPRVLLRPPGSVIMLFEEDVARLKLSSVEQLVLTDEIPSRAVGCLPSPPLGFPCDVVYVIANCRRAAALHADNEIGAAAFASHFGLPTIRIVVHDGGPRINAACAERGCITALPRPARAASRAASAAA